MNDAIGAALQRIKTIEIPVANKIIADLSPILSSELRFAKAEALLTGDGSLVLICEGGYPRAFMTGLGKLEFARVSVGFSGADQLVKEVLQAFSPQKIPTLSSGETMYFLRRDASGKSVPAPDSNLLNLHTPPTFEVAEQIKQARSSLIRELNPSVICGGNRAQLTIQQ